MKKILNIFLNFFSISLISSLIHAESPIETIINKVGPDVAFALRQRLNAQEFKSVAKSLMDNEVHWRKSAKNTTSILGNTGKSIYKVGSYIPSAVRQVTYEMKQLTGALCKCPLAMTIVSAMSIYGAWKVYWWWYKHKVGHHLNQFRANIRVIFD